METLIGVAFFLGIYVGFLLGREYAERGRGRFEARAAWTGRKRYRGTRPF